ncbi:MAG TPA: CoA transferase [Mycobacteriales bacterium]|nr:CoA transferase [Mycobacteriales bacterium]HWB68124.1 CoA transferase [Mycobacteriales bacterium]
MNGPLAGLRVIEVGHVLAGPYATMLLADLGADVIKVETDSGDVSRGVGSQYVDGHNVYFASINRNKRSVHIDLTTPAGNRQLHRLVGKADAVLANLRPSAIRKLGLTFDDLRETNPKIVCVALTGYGLDGPEADWPVFDYLVQAGVGLAAMSGEPDGPPMLPGYTAADNSSAIMAALGLLAKVREADVSGVGGQVDVSMFETMLSQLNYKAAAYLNGGVVPTRQPSGGHNFYVPAQLFPTAHGYLAMFVTHDEFWRRVCAELGRPEWATDARFATMHARHENRAELVGLLTARLAAASAADWEARLRPSGLPVAAVVGLDVALDSEHVARRGMIVEIPAGESSLRLVRSPIHTDSARAAYLPPPRLHEHTDELLGE